MPAAGIQQVPPEARAAAVEAQGLQQEPYEEPDVAGAASVVQQAPSEEPAAAEEACGSQRDPLEEPVFAEEASDRQPGAGEEARFGGEVHIPSGSLLDEPQEACVSFAPFFNPVVSGNAVDFVQVCVCLTGVSLCLCACVDSNTCDGWFELLGCAQVIRLVSGHP